MKIKRFILSLLSFPLFHSAPRAGGPDRAFYTIPPNPTPAPKRFPIPRCLKKEEWPDQGRLKGAPDLPKKRTYKNAHYNLTPPEDPHYNIFSLFNSLPYGITHLTLFPGRSRENVRLTKAALEKLHKHHPSLKHLKVFGPLPNVEKALKRSSFKSVLLTVEKNIPWLPKTLEGLSLQGKALPADRLAKALSPLRPLQSLILDFDKGFENLKLDVIKKLPHLTELKIRCGCYAEGGAVNPQALEAILNCALSRPLPPKRSLDVSLTLCTKVAPFIQIADRLKEGAPRLKELQLTTPFFNGPLLVNSLETERSAFHHLLSHVEDLSLSACDNLLTLFQGAEKLEKTSLQDLMLWASWTANGDPEEADGFISLLQLKSLKSLHLAGGEVFQGLFELASSSFDKINPLSLTSLKLDILNSGTWSYGEGFAPFIKALFNKAPLKSFSLSNGGRGMSILARSEDGYRQIPEVLEEFQSPSRDKDTSRYEDIIFESSLPSCLENFEIDGLFSKETLQKLFDTQILSKGTLKHLHLKDLIFCRGTEYWHPQTLAEFLAHFVPREIAGHAKEEGKPLTESEARKALNIHEGLEIHFDPL